MPPRAAQDAQCLEHNDNYVEDTESLWNKIYDADQRNYVITACTFEMDLCAPDAASKGSTKSVSAHAYAVISVHEFKHEKQ